MYLNSVLKHRNLPVQCNTRKSEIVSTESCFAIKSANMAVESSIIVVTINIK